MILVLIQNDPSGGIAKILAGPFNNWQDAEKAQMYWALRGKRYLEIIPLQE